MSNRSPFSDNDLQFNEGQHKYWLKSNPDLKFTSSTTFIGKFFETFNAPKIAAELTSEHPKYKHMTTSELLKEWNKSSVHGTKVHNQLEGFILDELDVTEDYVEDKTLEGIKWLKNTFDLSRHILYPEVRIYSKELQLSGTVDLLAHDPKKDIYIIADWKTNKKITRSAYQGKTGTHPATFKVEDCKYNKYALQMSLYRYMLETNYGINVKRQILVHLYDNGHRPYYTPYMENVIEAMIEECPIEK